MLQHKLKKNVARITGPLNLLLSDVPVAVAVVAFLNSLMFCSSATEIGHELWQENKSSFRGGGVAEWFRALDKKSGGPWFKFSTLLLSRFVLGSPEFNSSTALCK